jgi:hypothetical protein
LNNPETEFQGGTGAFIKGFVTKFSADATPVTPPSGPSTSNLPPPPSAPGAAPSNIHAVPVSGLSDPAKVIVSSNVTLTGGIVALGKNGSPPSTSPAWSPGLKIIPDYALLTGEKIPPVTPNIIDVRIVRQDVTADFPSPSPKPDNRASAGPASDIRKGDSFKNCADIFLTALRIFCKTYASRLAGESVGSGASKGRRDT